MSNRNKFKETFEQITMSEDCLKEIKEMKYGKKTTNMIKYAGAIAAAVAIVILTSNGVCYAMTGNSLVDTATNKYVLWTTQGVEREHVVVNGNLEEIRESIKKGEIPSQEVEGSAVTIVDRYIQAPAADEEELEEWVMYDFEYDGKKCGLGSGIYKGKDYSNWSIIMYVADESVGEVTYICDLEEENGRIYLTGEDLKIDITYDLKDGRASGEFIETSGPLEGKKLSYEVEGDLEDHKIEIKLVIEEY